MSWRTETVGGSTYPQNRGLALPSGGSVSESKKGVCGSVGRDIGEGRGVRRAGGGVRCVHRYVDRSIERSIDRSTYNIWTYDGQTL